MNGNQEVFRRIEKKYIVDEPTYEKLIKKLDGHFVRDRYYKSTICNIYYDTPSHQLVRSSIRLMLQKPYVYETRNCLKEREEEDEEKGTKRNTGKRRL